MTSGIFTFFNDLQLRNTEDPRLVTFGISISVNAVQDSNAAVFNFLRAEKIPEFLAVYRNKMPDHLSYIRKADLHR